MSPFSLLRSCTASLHEVGARSSKLQRFVFLVSLQLPLPLVGFVISLVRTRDSCRSPLSHHSASTSLVRIVFLSLSSSIFPFFLTMLLPTLLSITAFWATPALAFFKLPCDNPLIQERADPIISPGKVAGHVHTVNGGSNFALGSTYETMRKSKCSSCRAKADLSAYWTPQLYIEWANGTFSSVPHLGDGGGLM